MRTAVPPTSDSHPLAAATTTATMVACLVWACLVVACLVAWGAGARDSAASRLMFGGGSNVNTDNLNCEENVDCRHDPDGKLSTILLLMPACPVL